MESKLDSLTRKIYQEGVEKANRESDSIIDNAKKESEKIISDARAQADQIIKDAHNQAEELKRNTQTDLKLAGNKTMSSIKLRIKEMLSEKLLSEPTQKLFLDADFLREMILEIIKKWDPKEGIEIQFGQQMEKNIDQAFRNSIRKEISNLEITFNQKTSRGFKIIPKENTFQITFTEDDFIEFFKPMLNSKTEELLFDRN